MADYEQNFQGVRGYGVYQSGVNDYPGSVGVIASQRTSAPSGASQVMALTAVSGNASNISLDVALHDQSGQAYSDTNPLFVSFATPPGNLPPSYDVQTVGVGASVNHDTVISGSDFQMTQVIFSASDKSKFELQYKTSATGSFATIGVQFATPTENNAGINFVAPMTIPLGGTVRVIKTNQSLSAGLSIYDTVLGHSA